MSKASQYRDMTVEELEMSCKELQKKLFHEKNKAKHAKKVDQPHLVKQDRKTIARMLTVLHEKNNGSKFPHKEK